MSSPSSGWSRALRARALLGPALLVGLFLGPASLPAQEESGASAVLEELRSWLGEGTLPRDLEAVFTRRVRQQTDGGWIRARHRFRQRGSAVRLDIDVEGDRGVDSVTLVTTSGAWLLTEEGLVEVDPDAARRRLSGFAPGSLLELPLRLPGEPHRFVSEDLIWSDGWLRPAAGIGVSLHLAPDGGIAEAVVPTRHGETRYRYADYRDLGEGRRVPFVRETFRNETLLEELEFDAIGTLEGDEPSEWTAEGLALPGRGGWR